MSAAAVPTYLETLRERVDAVEARTRSRDVYELAAVTRALIGQLEQIYAWPQIAEEGGLVSKRELNRAISDFAATYLPERV